MQQRQQVYRFLRLDEVRARTGLSRSLIYEMMGRGEFPRPRQLSRQLVGWPEQDVVAWMTSRPLAGEEA